MSYRRAFTVIEILISVSVIVILVSIVIASFSQFNNVYNRTSGVHTVLTVLAQARAQTLSSKEDSSYGVHLETNQVISFKGTTYNPADPNNKTFVFPEGVIISSTTLSGGATEVVFSRLSGTANATGTVEVRHITDSSIRVLRIHGTGLAELEIPD